MYGAVTPGSTIKSENKAQIIIEPQPTAPTTYIVTVLDQGNNMAFIGQKTVTVSPVATGSLDNLFIPNAFSPNFDKVNDAWEIRTASKDPISSNKPIGAYKYKLNIVDRDGRSYANLENEVGVNGFGDNLKDIGLISGMSYWNGFKQGTLEEAPVGTYFYSLTFYNCTYPNGREFKGWIYLAR
ncbi:T9SS type B sorting domain-containing protein [Chitinophaga polysaccharea]|uniref:T9SS type B sorting domain-containing protein n=1 Tax=Chitinophaga polysaccharea TaxID=1293035 RepID=UPI001158A2DC|nr:gliding motility-associated C-terminal domain-containing protein [Chitinophaga polysaccharea]